MERGKAGTEKRSPDGLSHPNHYNNSQKIVVFYTIWINNNMKLI